MGPAPHFAEVMTSAPIFSGFANSVKNSRAASTWAHSFRTAPIHPAAPRYGMRLIPAPLDGVSVVPLFDNSNVNREPGINEIR